MRADGEARTPWLPFRRVGRVAGGAHGCPLGSPAVWGPQPPSCGLVSPQGQDSGLALRDIPAPAESSGSRGRGAPTPCLPPLRP